MASSIENFLVIYKFWIALIPLIFSIITVAIQIYNLYTQTNFERVFQSKFTQIKNTIIMYFCTSIFIISGAILLFTNDPKDLNAISVLILKVFESPLFYFMLIAFLFFITWINTSFVLKYKFKNFKITPLKINIINYNRWNTNLKIAISSLTLVAFILLVIFLSFPIGLGISLLIYPNSVAEEIDTANIYLVISFFLIIYFGVFYPIYQVFRKHLSPQKFTTIFTEDGEFSGRVLHLNKNKMVEIHCKFENELEGSVLIPIERIKFAKEYYNQETP